MSATRAKKCSWGLVLAPGAAATRDQPSLVAIDRAVTGLGVTVSRVNLPKGKAERAVKPMAAAAEALGVDRAVLGGRSFGGRVGSMAVAAGDVPNAAGLVLVSYPLHPPGKPDKPRTEHLPAIAVPCLFVSGTRDPFGTRDELEAATSVIGGEVTHVWIEGGDHGLRGKDEPVAAAVRDWVAALLAGGGG